MIDNCWYKDVCTQDCTASCIRYNEMKFLLDSSNIPESRQFPAKLTAGVDQNEFELLADIKSNIDAFVSNGDNLYLWSPETGNGKTSWAIKLMLKYFDTVWAGNGFRPRGLFIHTPTLLSQLKNFENPLDEDYKKLILNADLVIWDDIGGADLSRYDLGQLLIYVDQRILNKKSNIYTGNLDLKGLENSLGHRLASRIWNSENCIQLKGKDRR